MVRFIHAADIHLDSSEPRGLVPYDGAPVDACRQATRKALEKLVSLAINEQVDMLLIAGDVYDGDWKDARTGLFFINQLRRLREANIRCYMIRGNHDAASEISLHLPVPTNQDGTPMMLSHQQCQSISIEGLGTTIHGQGFASRAVKENIAANYAKRIPGHVNIGMLHTCLEGAEGHESYAPCTPLELQRKEYDYWALGHIHLRNPLPTSPQETPILFSGNLQGRHVRECGPKGAYLVKIDRGPAEIEFKPLDVYRWEIASIDLSGCTDMDQVHERFSIGATQLLARHPDMPLAIRCELTGMTSLHDRLHDRLPTITEQLRTLTISCGQERLWLEAVKIRTRLPTRQASSFDDEGPLSELIDYINELRGDAARLKELAQPLFDLSSRLPASIQEADVLRPQDPTWLREVLDEVQPLLVSRITNPPEDAP